MTQEHTKFALHLPIQHYTGISKVSISCCNS